MENSIAEATEIKIGEANRDKLIIMNNVIFNPEDYLSKNINFGYYNDTGNFLKINQDNKIKEINNNKNTYKVNVSYCYEPGL